MRSALAACVVLAGCRALFGIDDVPVASPDASGDAGTDAALGCDLDAPFGAPVRLDSLATSFGEGDPRLSPDELTIYYDLWLPPANSPTYQLYVATRQRIDEPFGSAAILASLDAVAGSAVPTAWPSPTPDGLALYFTSSRNGEFQIFLATRPDLTSDFGAPDLIGSNTDVHPYVTPSGTALYFSTDTRGGSNTNYAMYRAELAPDGSYDQVIPLPGIDPTQNNVAPAVTADERTLYFCHVDGGCRVWVATRSDPLGAWGSAQPLYELQKPSA